MTQTLVVTSNTPAALTPKRLISILVFSVVAVVLALLLSRGRPGEPLPQLAGVIGALLLLVPVVFSWHKRAGGAQRPRSWFVAHVLASMVGTVFIAVHLRSGNLWSPPGVVAAAMVFLVLQGVFARSTLGRQYARLFARSPAAFSPTPLDRKALAEVIQRKVGLLSTLDSTADEGQFSLQWAHRIQSPILSWRYARLVRKERRLVDAGKGVSPMLRYWRRVHLIAAFVFATGLIAHVIVMLFFAGYAAGGESPYWWHLFSWGADWGATQ